MAGIRVDTLLLDENLFICSFTPGMEQLLGLSQAEIGRPIGDLIARLGRSPVLADVHAAHQQLSTHERQLCIGEPARYCLARVTPCRMSGSPSEGLTVSLVDITELRQAQAQRDHLAAIVDSSADAIIATALDGTMSIWNRAAEKMFGYSAAEIAGECLTTLLSPEGRSEAMLLFDLLRSGGDPSLFETPLRRKDGTEFPGSVRLSPLCEPGGRLTGASAIIRDISRQRQVEERLRRQTRQVESFASAVSHDLRSPMLSIEGCAELIQELVRAKRDPSEELGMLRESVRQLSTLLKGLLNYARLEAQGVEPGACDCEEVLGGVLLALRSLIAGTHTKLSHGPLPVVWADEKMLPHVFQNLIENAIKYAGSRRPRIHISTEDLGREYCFRMRDAGLGIAPDRADHLFEPYRPHRVSAAGGLGMGLPICRKIIESHGGRLWFQSRPGAGSTFLFTLPKPPD